MVGTKFAYFDRGRVWESFQIKGRMRDEKQTITGYKRVAQRLYPGGIGTVIGINYILNLERDGLTEPTGRKIETCIGLHRIVLSNLLSLVSFTTIVTL